MKVLDGVEFILDEFKVMICKVILIFEFFFVVCGISFKNKGVKKMIDVVVDYFLLLLDILVVKVYKGENEEVDVFVIDDYFFIGLVFKVMIDLFVGLLIFIRFYVGIL